MDQRSAKSATSPTGLLRNRSGRLRFVWLAWTVAWLASTAGVGLGQPLPSLQRVGAQADAEAAELAHAYVELFTRQQRLKAGNAALDRWLARLDPIDQPGSMPRALLGEIGHADAETLGSLAGVLEGNIEPVVRDLADAAAGLDRQVQEAKGAWKDVRTSVNQRRFLLFEVTTGRRVAGQLASLLSVDKRWFWLFGVIAVGTLVAVAFHDRRHELRRMLNGGRARAMGLSKFLSAALVVLLVLTAVTFLMSERIYEALLTVGQPEPPGPRGVIETQNAALAAEVASLEQQRQTLEDQREQVEAGRRTNVVVRSANQRIVRGVNNDYEASCLAAAEAVAVLKGIAQALEADLEALEELDGRLAAQTEALAGYLRLRQWIRGGLGLALVGLAVAGAFFYRRGVEQRRRVTANTCPLCLGMNRLESVPDWSHHGDAPREIEMVRCKHVISEEPYEECDYSFMDVYRPMTKACFPTLGVPQAGKTHWLSMLYWELNRGNYPRAVQFEKLKSQSSEDFDVIVEEILRSRIGTAATQRDRIPRPLVFNFQDRDSWGRSNVLVNIFDYSGEVTSDMGLEDYRRRRALEGDGFFFFLDPTFPSEPQAKALVDFREDIRLVKGVKTGRAIRTPVAICVSKIDILAGQSYALPEGGDAIARFYDELSEIDPTGEAMTRDVIEARSQLMAHLRDTIWPGWQIERQVDDLFGGRTMFFPLTPVGLDGLGETDLSLRTISPFGLLEPLLWLLEMNGYPVLEGGEGRGGGGERGRGGESRP